MNEEKSKSATSILSELILASMSLWKKHYQEFHAHQSFTEKGATSNKFNTWQGDWTKFVQSFQKIYGFGANSGNASEYQEETGKILSFQDAFITFLGLLAQPFEKKCHEFAMNHDDMSAASSGKAENEELYNNWVLGLEREYATLFRSEEFVNSFQQLIHAASDASHVRKSWIGDTMRSISIPTKDDYDHLLKEFRKLKKDVREMARKLENLSKPDKNEDG